LKKLIIRIGNKSKAKLEKNVDILAKAIQIDLEQFEILIIDTIFNCVIHLGMKIPIYATLVGLISIEDLNFGKKIVKKLKMFLLKSLKQFDFFKIRHYVQFAACLQNLNVIFTSDIIKFLSYYLKQLKNKNLKEEQKDHVVHISMSCLMYSGSKIIKKYPIGIKNILDILKIYMKKR